MSNVYALPPFFFLRITCSVLLLLFTCLHSNLLLPREMSLLGQGFALPIHTDTDIHTLTYIYIYIYIYIYVSVCVKKEESCLCVSTRTSIMQYSIHMP